jgi:hypothetical protein
VLLLGSLILCDFMSFEVALSSPAHSPPALLSCASGLSGPVAFAQLPGAAGGAPKASSGPRRESCYSC